MTKTDRNFDEKLKEKFKKNFEGFERNEANEMLETFSEKKI